MNLRKFSIAVCSLLAGTQAAGAVEIDNTSLIDPPGLYYGAGNSNTNFTVDRTGSVETGLSAITRYLGPITPTGSTYDVPTGATTVPGKTGAVWGITFSVNVNDNGSNALNLSNVSERLSLTDMNTGMTGFFNPLSIPDNTYYSAGGVCTTSCTPLADYYGFQNSEALSFASIASLLDPSFNMNDNDTYLFTLTVLEGDKRLSTDSITVVAGTGTPVPEPLTLSLFGAGLAGAIVSRRRKKAKSA